MAEGSMSDTTDNAGGMLPSNVAPPPHVSLGLTGQHFFIVYLCCVFFIKSPLYCFIEHLRFDAVKLSSLWLGGRLVMDLIIS